MFSFFYDLSLLILGLLALPRFLIQRFVYGKYRQSLAERFGLGQLVISRKKKLVWIHAVSFGETRAISSLYRRMQDELKNTTFVITSVTETGHAEAKRSLPGADFYFFLPLDFSWLMRRFVKTLQPDLLILAEGDLWYNLLKYVKNQGAKVALVSGKLSERSLKRLLLVKFFARKLFALIDCFCVQSRRFEERFLQLSVSRNKIFVTGNTKLDYPTARMDNDEKKQLKEELGIGDADPVLVIGSTHASEEEWLLAAAAPLLNKLPKLKIIVAPRHPERFEKVAHLLRSRGYPLLRHSALQKRRGDERVILIDTMGKLLACYQIAQVAIVGGSFIPPIGGHNIYEPVQVGVPVIFGPYMQKQLDLVRLILESGAGRQATLALLPELLEDWLLNPQARQAASERAQHLAREATSATEATWACVRKFFN